MQAQTSRPVWLSEILDHQSHPDPNQHSAKDAGIKPGVGVWDAQEIYNTLGNVASKMPKVRFIRAWTRSNFDDFMGPTNR